MGLEVNMLSFLVIIYKRYNQDVVESCLKYFFVQRLGSAVILSMFYLNRRELSDIVFFVIGYRIGAAPFYFWFPSVCGRLGWLSCLILLIFQKIIPLMLVVIFIRWLRWVIIITSLVCGVFGSFNQSDIKQLFSYSSIHHLGWIFLCNLCSDYVWILYLAMYAFVIFGLVMILLKDDVIYIDRVEKGKSKVWFGLGILSIGGIPPILGFFLKWMAFKFIINISIIFVLVLVFTSVLMFYIYFRVVYNIFMCGGRIGYYLVYTYVNGKELGVDIVRILGIIIGLGVFLFF